MKHSADPSAAEQPVKKNLVAQSAKKVMVAAGLDAVIKVRDGAASRFIPLSQLKEIRSEDRYDMISVVVLSDDKTIRVALPADKLLERLRYVDATTRLIDLGAYTGKGYFDIMRQFDRAAGMTGGEIMDDGTIFLGKETVKLPNGVSLGKIFNVYAAPVDLGVVTTLPQAVEAVAALRDWHGYDGEYYKTDIDFFQAVGLDRYRGGWVIPTRSILTGKASDEQAKPYEASLYAQRGCPVLQNSFNKSSNRGDRYPGIYWSISNRGHEYLYQVLGITDSASSSFASGTKYQFSTRPVRLELV